MKPQLLVLWCLVAWFTVLFVVVRVLQHRDRRQARREAERKRPQVQALLDEMIALVRGWEGPMSELVFDNSRRKDVSDSRTTTTRSISLFPDQPKPRNEQRAYLLSVKTKPAKKTGESVNVSLRVSRDEESLHLYYPGFLADGGPLEPWLAERLDALFALVGDASGQREMYRKMDNLRRKLDDRSEKPPSN